MKSRLLQLETLEPRHLLSAWPAEVGFHADVFVDGGAHLSSRSLYAAKDMGLSFDNLLTTSASRTRAAIIAQSGRMIQWDHEGNAYALDERSEWQPWEAE